MSTDLVVRLREALDEAEEIAKRACYGMSVHPSTIWRAEFLDERGSDEVISKRWHVLNEAQVVARCPEVSPRFAPHIACWSPAKVLRLITSYRALLAAYEKADRYVAEHVEQCGAGLCACREYVTWTATSGALWMVVERAAEFWLGAKVADGDH